MDEKGEDQVKPGVTWVWANERGRLLGKGRKKRGRENGQGGKNCEREAVRTSYQIVVEVVYSKHCCCNFQEESRIVPLVCEELARSCLLYTSDAADE